MSTKHQKIEIKIPTSYSKTERRAIAQDIIDFIRDRSENKGLDKNNRPFAKYSKGYINSLDFKIAGKSKSKPNMVLSGDMLSALDILQDKKGAVVIGFKNGTDENARADGNIRGTYGQPRSIGPKRDFLGIAKKDLEKILDKYTEDDEQTRAERVALVLQED